MTVAVFFLAVSCAVNSEVKQHILSETAIMNSTVTVNKPHVLTGILKVLSLNIAHGRKKSLNQMLLSEATIRHNIGDIAAVLKKTAANIVALQEADGPSRWSGNFDHVADIARLANYPWYCRATHARSWLFDFGTALLSRENFLETLQRSFKPTPPTLTKGFLLGTFAWRPRKDSKITIPIDIVSVHLDYSRKAVREEQIVQLSEALSGRTHPLVVLGDFNSEWSTHGSAVAEFALLSGLHAYHPQATTLGTYKSGKLRFDWILISSVLEFKSYSVLPEVISDHRAIVAEIGIKPTVDINALGMNDHLVVSKACKGHVTCNGCE
jgi:endonuclease/exonuclease/phosphatase family metal-dependent hydrolase